MLRNIWLIECKRQRHPELGRQIHEHNTVPPHLVLSLREFLTKHNIPLVTHLLIHQIQYLETFLYSNNWEVPKMERFKKVPDIIQSLTWELNNPLKDECTLMAVEVWKSLRSINNVYRSGDIEPYILNFRTRWRTMVIFTSWSLNHHNHSIRGWMDYRNNLHALEKRKITTSGGNRILVLQLSTLWPNHYTDWGILTPTGNK